MLTPIPLTPYKAKVLEDLKEAVDEIDLVLSDKMEARDADELLKELSDKTYPEF